MIYRALFRNKLFTRINTAQLSDEEVASSSQVTMADAANRTGVSGPGRGELGFLIAGEFVGTLDQPLAEHPVSHRFRGIGTEHVQVCRRILVHHDSVLMPPRFTHNEFEADGLQLGRPRRFVCGGSVTISVRSMIGFAARPGTAGDPT